MKKKLLKMATILVVAFAIGAFVGISSPTSVQADGLCNYVQTCFIFTGPVGTGGCNACHRPYELWEGTAHQTHCCGDLLESGCYCVCC